MSEAVWLAARDAVESGRGAVLVAVVGASGSVPGTPGAVMVVAGDDAVGTVGGGIAESTMRDRAQRSVVSAELVDFRHEGASLCSGCQTFALVPLGDRDLAALRAVVAALENGRVCTVVLSPDGVQHTPGVAGREELSRTADKGWTAALPVGRLDTLTLVGGGHVSLAVSRVVATLPYRVRVLDDRSDLETMTANAWAHEKLVIDYRRVARHVPTGERSWAVVMTAGHAGDAVVLEGLVGIDLRYLGLLGSRAKVASLFADLESRGVPVSHLERVRAPVGVQIGSHTPEEIAISIAADLIRERNLGRQ